jgi:hypothetical protein
MKWSASRSIREIDWDPYNLFSGKDTEDQLTSAQKEHQDMFIVISA